MRRGDLVTAVLPRDFGKPRPALVIQSDAFQALPTASLLPLTSDRHDETLLRIDIEPTPSNGLAVPSQIQIDKISTVRRARLGKRMGVVDDATMRRVEEALGRFLGLSPT